MTKLWKITCLVILSIEIVFTVSAFSNLYSLKLSRIKKEWIINDEAASSKTSCILKCEKTLECELVAFEELIGFENSIRCLHLKLNENSDEETDDNVYVTIALHQEIGKNIKHHGYGRYSTTNDRH